MQVHIENDFQQKIMSQSFSAEANIGSSSDVQAWRDQWTAALKSWHAPYKVLIDVSRLAVKADDPEVPKSLARMLRFFEGLFLKKAAGFGTRPGLGHEHLPFPVFATEEEAAAAIGVRVRNQAHVADGDFRTAIQIQNHFNQHVVEITFQYPVVLKGKAEVDALKSKLTNNLMQWHSKWSMIIDCSNLTCEEDAKPHFATMQKFLTGFFLKKILGYQPAGAKDTYPFEVFRARHNAAGRLEAEGTFGGDEAQCRSKGVT